MPHGVHNFWELKWVQKTQDTYKPFELFSSELMTAIKNDLKLIMGSKRDPNLVSIEELRKPKNYNQQFKIVHMFIEIFSELLKVQKEYNGKSWMDVQISINRLVEGYTTLKDGKEVAWGAVCI